MTDRPIIMSAPMVRALLREVEAPGTGKTMTRRLAWSAKDQPTVWQKVRPGDRLWVRERAKNVASGEVKAGYGEVRYGVAYDADGAVIWSPFATKIWDLTGRPGTGPMQFRQAPYRPSIHMRRCDSRLTLLVSEVRVERLQDITPFDAVDEGIDPNPHLCGCEFCSRSPDYCTATGSSIIMAFADLWRSLHGQDAWEANPWVVAIRFRPVLANIDSIKEAA